MSTLFPTNSPALRRPVLRWHGGKWVISKWIIQHFPSHRIYCEPFGGAASVLMRKPRAFAEIYNDLDDDLVNLFRVLRDPLKAVRLMRLLKLTPWSRTEFFDAYEATSNDIEWARRTVVRSFMGFGTTGKMKNRTGFRGRAERNNSTGVGDWQNYPDVVPAFVERLKGVTIENRPALDLIKAQDGEDTLFYLDPPYPHSTRTALRGPRDHGRCYAFEMHDTDHRKLAMMLHSIKGMAVISGYRCALYDEELYPGWQSVERSANADGGKKRTEVLWLNPAASNALALMETK